MIEVINKNLHSTHVYDNDDISISYNSKGELAIKITYDEGGKVSIVCDEGASKEIIKFCKDKIADFLEVPF
ncbi:hypothetical protein [Orenia marismortui]|uniref:hypothetical protein n=1 Tax=Orenia marismortui TaxID=46469 RepID=UPI0012F732A5|nr:hypothetical protein [Orenia marismortui]